jgi:hypothetical protein
MGSTEVNFGLLDYSNEPSRTRLYFEELDDENYAGLFGTLGAVPVAQEALEILTGCTRTGTTATILVDAGSSLPPENVNAQREIAIRVSYQDTVTAKRYRFDVPGPIDELYPPQGTDIVPLSNLIAAAFIAVFEEVCRSVDGNAVVVTSIRLVGRNN